MVMTSGIPLADAIANLSFSEQKTLDHLFGEAPALKERFIELATRKAAAMHAGDAASIHRIAEEEDQLFKTAMREAVGE